MSHELYDAIEATGAGGEVALMVTLMVAATHTAKGLDARRGVKIVGGHPRTTRSKFTS